MKYTGSHLPGNQSLLDVVPPAMFLLPYASWVSRKMVTRWILLVGRNCTLAQERNHRVFSQRNTSSCLSLAFFWWLPVGETRKLEKKNLFGVRCLKIKAFSESGLMEEKGSVGLWRTQSCTPQVLEGHAGGTFSEILNSTRVLIFRSLSRFYGVLSATWLCLYSAVLLCGWGGIGEAGTHSGLGRYSFMFLVTYTLLASK